MIEDIVQPILDFFSFFHWLFANLRIIFICLLSPVNYIFAVVKFFWASAFLTPANPDLSYTFSPQVLAVFNALPFWSSFTAVIGAVIILVGGIAILKLFTHT